MEQFADIGRWGNVQTKHEETVYKYWLEMPQEKWENGARNHLKTTKNVRAAMRWVDHVQALRQTYIPAQPYRPIRVRRYGNLDADYLLLEDMLEEPEKYGNEIQELMDDIVGKLMSSPKAWRVNALIRREQQKQAIPKLIKFQALWRGHRVRCEAHWTSCANCLCHKVSIYGSADRSVCEDCYYLP
jgi:hypothetical protein